MVKIMPARRPRRLEWLKAWFRGPVTGIPEEICVPPGWDELQEMHPEVNVLKTSQKPRKQPMTVREYKWHVRNGYPSTGSFLYCSVGMGYGNKPKKPWECEVPK